MRTGSPIGHPALRLEAARVLAAREACAAGSDREAAAARRVISLRDRVGRGAYRVDAVRLAASLYEALLAGGL
jgi:anti-sigma28 factor (negative regulator of flagellin synthesis)